MDVEQLFWKLYKSSEEDEIHKVLGQFNLLNSSPNWRPYGQNESNYGVVENQQASPIPALIEKITNGIDAIFMRACIEQGVNPRSEEAPRSIDQALKRFFPDHKNWDLRHKRRTQAERLQILADGPRLKTSLIIYDDGEGQRPEFFESTFLSLLRGNKNDIHFVQGKYNMGGAGAIVFCGKRRYQLTGSKRFDGGPFGFTLIRRHPLTPEEEKRKKATWYEYLVVDEKIPAFPSRELDLGLHNRKFTTGTIIKLYSYDLPASSRSVISRDLNQSINEYLFNPALPVFTVDKAERYPDDRNLERELYGLKRRLEEDDSKYISQYFSEDVNDHDIGHIRVTCYIFTPRVDSRSVKETRDTIQREFFKNNMSVLFSVNGQVHGHYTSEFITRSLKFPLIKDYLLIHVDCTEIHTEFRNELFMASRDRLKDADESRRLRSTLADLLSKGRLKDIHKERKASITIESEDIDELVQNLTRNLPIQKELAELLNQTFKLGDKRDGRRNEKARESEDKEKQTTSPFSPERYPSFFNIDTKSSAGDIPMIRIPIGGEKLIKFSTDVEDQYFDRVEDPGELQIALLDFVSNEVSGGNSVGDPKILDKVLNVSKSSPSSGTIQVRINPTGEVRVGDSIKLNASLSSPDRQLNQIILIKISAPEKKTKEPKKGDQPDTRLGLPELIRVYKDPGRGSMTWDKLEEAGTTTMDHHQVVYPLVDGEGLSAVYINMDSNALLTYRAKLKNEKTIAIAEKRYLSAVYFHTLFLYTITKNRKYGIVKQREQGNDENIEITDYISDLFSTFYAQFLLNFDIQELIDTLDV